MRQVVVAVNFGDLMQLKQAVNRALDDLLYLPDDNREVSITFRWAINERACSMSVESQGFNRQYAFCAPQGVSAADWVELVSAELENHFLSGSRFTLEEMTGDFKRNVLVLDLERV